MLKGIACCIFGKAVVTLTRAGYSGELVSLVLFVLSASAAFGVIGMGQIKRRKTSCECE